MTDKNEDWPKMVQIASNEPSPFTGNIYPEEVMRKSFDAIVQKRGPLVYGECGSPKQWISSLETVEERNRRHMTVAMERVSHKIDLSTVEYKDGKVFAMMSPAGPLANVLIKNFENGIQPTIGMRSLVRYKEGNTTQTQNLTIEHCNILSFDLINPDN